MVLLAFQEVRLVPDGTIFIHIALILLMIWALNRTFFRPINRVIESRERNKGGRSSEAQEILKNVGEKQSRYEAAMLEARNEGYGLIERERTQAIADRQEKNRRGQRRSRSIYRAGKSGIRPANRRNKSISRAGSRKNGTANQFKYLEVRFKIQDFKS